MNVTRQHIADALNSANLDGVQATAAMPDTIHPGMAWPEHVGFDPAGICVYAHEWVVKVALPNGALEATTDALDAWGEDVANALLAVGEVGRGSNAEIPIGDVNLRALFIELVTS